MFLTANDSSGDALFQTILDDPMLSIGRNGTLQLSLFTPPPADHYITGSVQGEGAGWKGFQILHAYHSLERILGEYQRRRANFEIVFWDGEDFFPHMIMKFELTTRSNLLLLY